jgi:hypothetical protein
MSVGAASTPAERLKLLASAAVIGVDRAGGQAPSKVLAQVARAAVIGRAGRRPSLVAAQMEPCPGDATPAVSSTATLLLGRLLNDPDAILLDEWAVLAKGRGRRVADVTVPALLDWWARQPRRSEAVFAVTGQRGRWLASLNPDWRKPVAVSDVPANADEAWSTGTSAERGALLTTIRRHDPARALALVQSTWASDGADERRRFVDALTERRSMADEPFLESALDDRSKTVRRAAASVLARIPGSRLKARLTQLARDIIVVEKQRKGVLRREGVAVSLKMPQDFDPKWDRDGIDEQVPSGKGKRAWWMHQILRDAEIGIWAELTGLEPAAILENFEKESTNDAIEGLTHSAIMSGDGPWAAALLRAIIKKEPKQAARAEGLWITLKPHDREPLMLEALSAGGFTVLERWALFASVDAAWSLPFSLKALDLLKRESPSKKVDAWQMASTLDDLSRRIAPKALDAFEQAMSATFGEEHTQSVQKIIDRLRLRAEIHKEFES